jgi:DNA topoisomerase-1
LPRLRRSDPRRPGITRHRRGRGFSYSWDATGDRVDDEQTLERIAGLVIPPAWDDVWISPWPHGHIQAVGTDAAGRRQYLYHPDWRRRRDAEKFQRALAFGAVLPDMRRAVARDLAGQGLGEARVLAAAVRLLDIGCFRIGGEAYAREHETFGIATLRREHVTIRGDELDFSYPAKGSVERTLTVRDDAVLEVLAPLRRRRGGSGQLLAWKGDAGWVDVHSADINTYLKATAGEQFSAKDFRTWSGTVFAAVVLAQVDPIPRSATARRRTATAAVREVSDHLGNTPAVCRASYIDPRVLDHFDQGETISDHGWPGRARGGEALRDAAEAAVLRLLGDADELAA